MAGWNDVQPTTHYSTVNTEDEDILAKICAKTINHSISVLTKFQQHTVPELDCCRQELGLIRNLCANDDFNVNLGSDNSLEFQGLNNLGIKSESLRSNSDRFFASISSRVLANVTESLMSVFEFIIDLNTSGFSTLWVGEILNVYDVSSYNKFVDAIYYFLVNTYKFPEEVQFHMTLNLFSDDLIRILKKVRKHSNPLSDQDRITLSKIITKGLHFEFHFVYRSVGLYLQKISNSNLVCNKTR
nr:p28 [Sweet potato chlorotic stunt virus]